MLSNFQRFAEALWAHYVTAVTGGVLALIMLFAGIYLKRTLVKRCFWVVLVFAFAIASYQAWFDEKKALDEQRQAFIDEHAARVKSEGERNEALEQFGKYKLQEKTVAGKQATSPWLRIIYPEKDGDTTGPTTKVAVDTGNVPPNLYLWIVMRSRDGGSFPWANCASKETCISKVPHPLNKPSWEAEGLDIGGPDDAHYLPLPYTIEFVAVDSKENDRLIGSVKDNWPEFKKQGSRLPIRSVVSAVPRVVTRTQ